MADLVSDLVTEVVEGIRAQPGRWATAAVLAAILTLIAAVDVYLLLPPSTDRRLLRAGLPRRWFRAWRSWWQRLAAGWLAWPHALIVLRQRRVRVHETPYDVVVQLDGAHVRRYRRPRRAEESRPPVLLVHALVTHPWILDLAPGRSFVRALLDRGHDVYLLAWDPPGRRGGARGLAAMLGSLEEAIAELVALTGERLHLVGYCSGGLLALIRLASAPTPLVASLTLVATPVDLEAPGGIFALVRHPQLRPAWVLDGRGCVPASLVREAFHLQHRIALRSALARWRLGGVDAERYDALDRWVFQHRALEGALLFDLVDLARGNALARGGSVAGAVMRPAQITMPCLVALAERDHLVPAGSSLAALDLVPNAELLHVPSGHVGMVAGSASVARLYGPVSDWIATR